MKKNKIKILEEKYRMFLENKWKKTGDDYWLAVASNAGFADFSTNDNRENDEEV